MRTPKTVYALFKQGAKRWIKYHLARTSKRRLSCVVEPQDIKAECFCLLGAIRRVYGRNGKDTPAATIARNKLKEVIGGGQIAFWNDHPERTFRHVLAAVKKAGI